MNILIAVTLQLAFAALIASGGRRDMEMSSFSPSQQGSATDSVSCKTQVGVRLWWINIGTAPLLVEFPAHSDRSRPLLRNVSSKTITAYEVRVIRNEAGTVRIVDDDAFMPVLAGMVHHGGFIPGTPYELSTDLQSIERLGLEEYARGRRLAVVDVLFADGSRWTAEGESWPDA